MPVAEPKELSPQDCEMIDVDFSTLVPGQYITDELQSKYGLSVSAVALSGGFTPFGAARVFDTANPTSATDRLGSPNGDCGGKSWGNGGKRASPHQNCDPLGNVVLVQAKDSEKVDDNYSPSYLNFDFDEPVHVENIVLMQAYGRKEIIVNVRIAPWVPLERDSSISPCLSYQHSGYARRWRGRHDAAGGDGHEWGLQDAHRQEGCKTYCCLSSKVRSSSQSKIHVVRLPRGVGRTDS